MPMFRSVAELKRSIKVGTQLHCYCHGLTITNPDGTTRKSELFPEKDYGIVTVQTVQANALAFDPHDGCAVRSWQRWRKAADIILTDSGFILAGKGETRMEYTFV